MSYSLTGCIYIIPLLLWYHFSLNIQIIHVNLTQESPKLLEPGKKVDLTYSVKWTPTNIAFIHRFDVYLDYPFFERQIHWLTIFNSFMAVIFLMGLVSMILMRTLRNDYAKYACEDDDLEFLERDVSKESEWKLVHRDVFGPPRSLALSVLIGTGAQLTLLILLVIVLAFLACYILVSGDINSLDGLQRLLVIWCYATFRQWNINVMFIHLYTRSETCML